MNIPPVGAELFHTDGWTEMMNLTVAFCKIAKAPYKLTSKYLPVTINTTIHYVFSDEFQGYMFRQPRCHLPGMNIRKNKIIIATLSKRYVYGDL